MKLSNKEEINTIVSVINQLSNDIVICGHKNADYDSMCSSLALCYGLRKLGKKSKVYIEIENLEKIKYFNCEELLCNSINLNNYTFIAMDLNRISRLPSNMERYYQNAKITINIDHHNGNTTNANYVLSNSNTSSTCEIVYNILKKLNIRIDKKISELIFAGIISDTNLFSNDVSYQTFQAVTNLMKYKINNEYIVQKFYLEKNTYEFEIISYIIKHLKYDEFHYAVLNMNKSPFNKVPYSDISKKCIPTILNRTDINVLMIVMNYGNKMKGEIRSKNNIDVSKLAELLTGGGHTRAAGFSNTKTLKEIIKISKDYLGNIDYYV